MTTLSAAWSRLEQDQEAADDRYARELAAHPLELFEVTAWEHAFDEPGYELLLHLSEDLPATVLFALCVFAECPVPNRLGIFDSIDREASRRAIRLRIESWISTEQEALQALAVEEIFP